MDAGAHIILIHGLCMHGVVFALQRRRLQRLGYKTHTFSYPSVRGDLVQIADQLASRVASLDAERVFLVGHSLGGLVVLTMLARRHLSRVRRVVLLGPPCCDSHCARVVLRVPLLGRVIGRPLRQWLERPLPDPRGMPDVGVIAGDRPLGVGRLLGLPKPHDGMVAVKETHWPWATDRITLRVTHMQMLISAECLAQTVRFLESGAFDAHGTRNTPAGDQHVGAGGSLSDLR